jgi:superfamily II DNA or RNA helicase
MQLRDYQEEDLKKLARRFREGVRRPLIHYDTGLGKSVFYAVLAKELGFKKRVLVVADRDELIEQGEAQLKRWNPDETVGVEKAERRTNGERFVVASIQSIGRADSNRLDRLNPNEFDALVIDECDLSHAPSYWKVIEHFDQNPDIMRLGLSATINRADGKPMSDIFQEIVAERTLLWGIKEGWLSDISGVRIRTHTDISSVRTQAGDFRPDEYNRAIDTPARNRLVADAWLEHAKWVQTVMFTRGIQHAKNLAQVFQQRGVDARPIWGDDPDRETKLLAHKAKHFPVLINSDLLIRGYDDWQIACIGMVAGTQSPTKYEQIIGRGSRIPTGIENIKRAKEQGIEVAKTSCLVIDYADNTTRHSLATLGSLFGLSDKVDLRGRKISDVMAEVEEIQQTKPYVDITNVTDIAKLQAYAEQVDLFKVTVAPEVIQLSEFLWVKTGQNAYVLLLKDGDHVTVLSDMLDKWHVVGQVNGAELRETHGTFEDALKEADYKVQLLGGKSTTRLAQRTLKKDDGDPSPAQRLAARSFGITIPPGATFGQVRLKLNKTIADIKARRLGKIA